MVKRFSLSVLVFRYHRWLGFFASIAVMLWGASGVLHPVISRLNPQAVFSAAPPQAVKLHNAITPAQALARYNIENISALRVVEWPAGKFYQAAEHNRPELIYLNSKTGEKLSDGDKFYAEYLARHYVGDYRSAITEIKLLTDFDDEYLPINRLLPVYRVFFARADGMRAT